MFWGFRVKLESISFSINHVMFKVKNDRDDADWFCSGMYGWPDGNEKYTTWSLLEMIK